MPTQSKELATETQAMRRIEAAFAYADELPPKVRERVLRWAREVHLAPEDEGAGQ